MKTLSIDASTRSTGIAVFDNSQLIFYKCIEIKSSDQLKRIEYMANEIEKIIIQYQPTDIVMQQILPEDVKHNQNVYKALIYLQAAIILKAHKHKREVELVVASHWRAQIGIRTGRGIKRNELKTASKKLVKAIYNIDVNDDISDAICIGIAYIKEHRSAF